MKYASILPPAVLQDYDLLSRDPIRMALAHQLLGDDDLVSYFRVLRQVGVYIILDNGVMETGKSLPIETLLDLASTGCCDEVVLPDWWRGGYETVKLVDEALQKVPNNSDVKWMGVVQGRTLDEALTCYLYLLRHPKVDVIGIPKVMEAEFGRGQFTCLCMGVAACDKPVHLLGIWSCPSELMMYKTMPEIRSCDSNYPAAAALEYSRLQRHSLNGKPHISPQDFEKVGPERFAEILDIYKDNLETMYYFAESLCE